MVSFEYYLSIKPIDNFLFQRKNVKILYFNDYRLGILKGDQVVDVTQVVQGIPHVGPGDLINSLIEHFEDFRARIADHVAKNSRVVRNPEGEI